MKKLATFAVLLSLLACRSNDAEGPAQSGVDEAVEAEQAVNAALGSWSMVTNLEGKEVTAIMKLERGQHGVTGVWSSGGTIDHMENVVIDGADLSFKRTMGEGEVELYFKGKVNGDMIIGSYRVRDDELVCTGKRVEG